MDKIKAVIVNRVSSSKQNPTLQLNDCLNFCKRKNFEVIKVLSEVASAGKSKQKQIYEAEQIAIKENAVIVVWKYDRSFRNKKDFANFMLNLYELHNIKVYSVQEEWVNMLWELSESFDYEKIPYPYNEAIKEQLKLNWKLMIKIVGKIAEDEIKDKGARVKLAVVKQEGKPTKSYKGNRWGRKGISEKTKKEILEAHNNGLSIRGIADSVFIWDKNNHRKNISRGVVHKTLQDFGISPLSHKLVSNNSTIKRQDL